MRIEIEIDWSIEEQVKLKGWASWTVDEAKWNAADEAGRREMGLEAIASSFANALWDQLQDKVALTVRPVAPNADACGCPVRPAPEVRGCDADTLVEHESGCTAQDQLV